MTIDDFIKELRETREWEWEVQHGSGCRVRRSEGGYMRVCHCPITAVAAVNKYPTLGSLDFGHAAGFLGLADKADEIVRASDCLPGYNRPLRRRILRAVGLGR